MQPFRVSFPAFGTVLTVAMEIAEDDVKDVSFYKFDFRFTGRPEGFLFRFDNHPGHESDPGHSGRSTHLHWIDPSTRIGGDAATLADVAGLVARLHTEIGRS